MLQTIMTVYVNVDSPLVESFPSEARREEDRAPRGSQRRNVAQLPTRQGELRYRAKSAGSLPGRCRRPGHAARNNAMS